MPERDALVDGAALEPADADRDEHEVGALERVVEVGGRAERHAVAVLGGLTFEYVRDALEPPGVDVVQHDVVERLAPQQRAVHERDAKAAAPDDRQLHAARISAIPAAESSALGRNPEAAARREAGTVVAAVPAGGQHDRRGVLVAGELLADLEPVEVGELHVQQDEVGAQLARGCDRAQPVLGLADDVVPLELEEPAGRRPEGGVIVDDEDACSHRESVELLTRLPKVVTMRTDGRATAPSHGGLSSRLVAGLTWQAVLAWRVRRQRLAERARARRRSTSCATSPACTRS